MMATKSSGLHLTSECCGVKLMMQHGLYRIFCLYTYMYIYICIIGTPEKTYIFFQCFRDLNIELSRFHATLSQESSTSNVQAQQCFCLIIEYLRFRGKLFQESSMFNVQSTNNSMLDLLIFMNVSNY